MINICIVEDEFIIAKDWELFLTENGYNVCATAKSCIEALHAATNFKPDFYLMDINVMGNVDGIQIALMLQKYHVTNIIFHSTLSPSYYSDRLKNVKYIDYLIKPASKQKLISIIRTTTSKA